MNARDQFGVPVILTGTTEHTIRRSKDWVEPLPEGEWQVHATEAGDDE